MPFTFALINRISQQSFKTNFLKIALFSTVTLNQYHYVSYTKYKQAARKALTGKADLAPIEGQKDIENHKKAAEHHQMAAKHHLEAAHHHETGAHEKAAEHTVAALGHAALANEHQKEDVKHHAVAAK